MVEEVYSYLEPALSGDDSDQPKTYYDLTLGLGGHTEYFMARLPNIHAVGIDRDQDAIIRAEARLSSFGERFQSFHGNYDQIEEAVAKTGRTPDAVLMDLGVSSMQLDNAERGFNYSKDTALDMRMNQDDEFTAAKLVDDWGVDELADVIYRYGEEKHAKGIARAIKKAPPRSTYELADAVRSGLPAKLKRHAYAMSAIKRVFQALRIAVNDELQMLERTLPKVVDSMNLGGRVAVLSYHSLEDRIVKNAFKEGAAMQEDEGFRELPYTPAGLTSEPYLKLLTRQVVRPSDAEVEVNSRAKSALLRVAEKVSERG
jgi:16S rRNA (cytosine1402-N4)-methyltransferase